MGRISEEAVAERLERCRELMAQGMDLTEMSVRIAVDRMTLYRFLSRKGLLGHLPRTGERRGRKPRHGLNRRPGYNGGEWGRETADPSRLTPEQLAHARRVGIKPARYAWLLSCPCCGREKGWNGGASIG